MKKPMFSIGLPVYNRVDQLKFCVGSVLKQTFQDFELIIVDNCSTDGTWEYIQSIKDKRVKKFRNNTNIGMVPNWRKTAEYASGEYFRIMMSDDILGLNSLEILKEIFIKNKYKPITNGYLTIDNSIISFNNSKNYNIEIKKTVNRQQLNKKLFLKDFLNPSCITAKLSEWEKLFFSKEYLEIEKELGKTGHFVDFFITESIVNKHNEYISIKDNSLFGYRKHENNASNNYTKNILWLFGGLKYVVQKVYTYSYCERYKIFNLFLTKYFITNFLKRIFTKEILKVILEAVKLFIFLCTEIIFSLKNKIYINEKQFLQKRRKNETIN